MTGPMAKFSKYFKFFVFLSLPITSTMPAAIVLNWTIMSLFQLSVNMLTFTQRGRKILKMPDYLPGSLLEKFVKANQNTKKAVNVLKPKIFSAPPKKLQPGEKLKE
mmetsp:Transcript_1881/g.4097  ORF Transcript_1881/g.4097 Transcript_1881/m.4097 type:complete len:106 (-) Transcript_1881:10683-11000(-)